MNAFDTPLTQLAVDGLGQVGHKGSQQLAQEFKRWTQADWMARCSPIGQVAHQGSQLACRAVRLLGIDMPEQQQLIYPVYDLLLKCSHTFNMLHARGALSVAQRQDYVGRIRMLAQRVAEVYVRQREALGHPLLDRAAAPVA